MIRKYRPVRTNSCNRRNGGSRSILHDFQYTGSGEDVIEFVRLLAFYYGFAFRSGGIVLSVVIRLCRALLHGALLVIATVAVVIVVVIVWVVVGGRGGAGVGGCCGFGWGSGQEWEWREFPLWSLRICR